jgi:maltooligosyltrehalose trehalohydrolase
MPFGAAVTSDGVDFGLWAPSARTVEIDIDGRVVSLHATADGWYRHHAPGVAAGTRYRYRIDGELFVPDPASRFNPDDVHGASVVVDPRAFAWTDGAWRGRPWREAVVYELHVGTFSPEGTFAGVQARLDYLAHLGVTAIELMPLADFPGKRNWGYDGVLPFAPDARYGTPDDLRSLVDAAHARNLMVLVDVVYNHFGPEGNYLHRIAQPFFTDRHQTPWGAAIDFDGGASRAVREFFVHNALYWIEEFHADGLRLDAVHAIVDDSSPDFLTELARRVREGPGREREIHLVLENDRNDAHRLARNDRDVPVAYTAQWNDDFHHVAHHLLTRERHGYYADYAQRPLALLGRCLAEGFAFQGEASPYRKHEERGEPSAHLPPDAFVNFLQNHDQVGNRAFGERLHALAPPAVVRSFLPIFLLAPSIPLLFMGEEFAADSPFLFFADFGGDLANAVRDGRRAEFAGFPPFDDEDKANSIPDPGAESTFAQTRLRWESIAREPHATWLRLYRELLAVRAQRIVPILGAIVAGQARYHAGEQALDVMWRMRDQRTLHLAARLVPDAPLRVARGDVIWESRPGDAWTVRWSIGHD